MHIWKYVIMQWGETFTNRVNGCVNDRSMDVGPMMRKWVCQPYHRRIRLTLLITLIPIDVFLCLRVRWCIFLNCYKSQKWTFYEKKITGPVDESVCNKWAVMRNMAAIIRYDRATQATKNVLVWHKDYDTVYSVGMFLNTRTRQKVQRTKIHTNIHSYRLYVNVSHITAAASFSW